MSNFSKWCSLLSLLSDESSDSVSDAGRGMEMLLRVFICAFSCSTLLTVFLCSLWDIFGIIFYCLLLDAIEFLLLVD